MEKYFDINREGCSVRCLLHCDKPSDVRQVIVYGHGFGGHKESRSALRFARYVLSKRKDTAVLCFDWPCHGTDGRKKLLLSDCDRYLTLVTDYAREHFQTDTLYGFATSFGGYLYLKYITEHPNPFRRTVLRCPAVQMYSALIENILSPDELEKLKKGKDVLAGFDRKVRISPDFLESLKKADITERNYLDVCESLLIVHGTRDEIIPIAPVAAFADDKLIPLLTVEGADHRFLDPVKLDLSIRETCAFFWS